MESQLVILLQVGLAAVLGGIIGAEREYGGKAAGLRTHMIVCAASALLLGLGRLIALSCASNAVDPSRVIQAVVTGISFLGAGTIIFHKREGSVEGLTTAASILLVAAVGMAVAIDAYFLAVGVTVCALIVLSGMGGLEKWLRARRKGKTDASQENDY